MMVGKRPGIAVALAVVAALSGCDSGRVKEQTVELHMTSGVERAKEYLQNYANGEPIGSEAASFAQVVDEARNTDPAKADLLEKGFADLLKAKGQRDRTKKAKDLLDKL